MSALGALLRRLREESGLTQEELADRAGVSARTVSDTERGLRSRLYADTAARLATGLGLDDPTRSRFVEVARGRPGVDRVPVNALPRSLTPLVGRQNELAALMEQLQPAGRRLVTVTGLGGVGKTRLAITAAEGLSAAHDGRVCFVQLTQGSDPLRLTDVMAAALGTAPSSIPAGVAGRPTLMVLDSFEHVLPATGTLREVLQGAPELQVLATSRERLHIAGEVEIALGPLLLDAAADLFLQRVQDLDPRIPVDPEVVADVCRILSGLPLPLELAAAHLRYLPLDLLRDRLGTGLTDARTVVEEAVNWSVSSLSGEQRAVLATAAMFEAGWELGALEAVSSDVDVVEALGALADHSLIGLLPGGGAPRWRMLDVVRSVALRLEPERPGQREAFTSYYLALLAGANAKLGEEEHWYQVLAAEEANVRRALAWAESDGDATTVLTLATGMWLYWQARGGLDEGRDWLDRGLNLRPPAERPLRAAALWGLAWLAYHQGDDDAAEEAGRQLATLAEDSGDQAIRRNSLTIAGMVAIARDQPEGAVSRLADALDVARGVGQPWIQATSTLNLGIAYLALDAPEQARPVLGEALSQYREINDERFHARCLGYLGLTSLMEDDSSRAGALFSQSLRAFVDLDEPGGTAEGMAGLAAVAAATNEPYRAATLAAAAERLRETVAARELPLERRALAPYLTKAKQDLGSTEWARSWKAGRELELPAAVSLALEQQNQHDRASS
jgi:predicted ATPase/DNA-binding XRE family transcriptional regulator